MEVDMAYDLNHVTKHYLNRGEEGVISLLLERYLPIARLSKSSHKTKYDSVLWNPVSKLWIVHDTEEYLFREVFEFVVKLVWTALEECDVTCELMELEDELKKQTVRKRIWSHIKNRLIDEDFLKDMNNADPDSLPIRGGKLLNLQTGSVRERIPSDKYSFELTCSYLGKDVPLKNIHRFMMQICHEDLKLLQYLTFIIGACLTGRTNLRSFFVFHGVGSNGKTALLSLLKACLGRYYQILDKKALLERGNKSTHDEHLMPLRYARVAVCSETRPDDHFDDAVIKAITGDSDLSVRKAYAHAGESMHVNAKVIIDTNFYLLFNANDKAMIDRLKVVPFLSIFDGDVTESTRGRYRKDRNFVNRLETELLDEVFTYFARGAETLYQQAFTLEKPKLINEHIQRFIDMQDPVKYFISSTLEKLPIGERGRKYMLAQDKLIEVWKQWLMTHRLNTVGVSANKELKRLLENLKPYSIQGEKKEKVLYRYRLKQELVMVDELEILLKKFDTKSE